MATGGILDFIIRAKNETGKDIQSAAQDLQKLGKQADATGKQLDAAFKIEPLQDFEKEYARIVAEAEKNGQSLADVFNGATATELQNTTEKINTLGAAIEELNRPSEALAETAAAKFNTVGNAIEKAKQDASDFRGRVQSELQGVSAEIAAIEKEMQRSGDTTKLRENLNAKKGQKVVLELQLKGLDIADQQLDEVTERFNEVKQNANIEVNADTTKAIVGATSLRQRYKELKEEEEKMLYAARITGDANAEAAVRSSARFKDLQNELKIIKDTMGDVGSAAGRMASDTAGLDALRSGLQGVSGAFSAVTGGVGLFTKENENLQKVMLKVQSVMSITMGLKEMDNLLNKDSAFQLVIGNKARQIKNVLMGKEAVVTKNGTKAIVANTAAQTAGTVAAVGFKGAIQAVGIAMKGLLASNPFGWILLAITAVVAAVSKLVSSFETAEEKATRTFEAEKNRFDSLKASYEEFDRWEQLHIKNLERQLELAKAAGKSSKELQKLEDKALEARKHAAGVKKAYYWDLIKQEEEIRMRMEQATSDLQKAQDIAIIDKDENYSYTLDGEQLDEDAEDAVNRLKEHIEYWKGKLDFIVGVKTEYEDADFEKEKRKAEREKEAKDNAKAAAERAKQARQTELNEERATEDLRISMWADSLEKELELQKINSQRKIEDLRNRLKTEENLTVKARKAMNEQITLLQQEQAKKEEALRIAAAIKRADWEYNMASREINARSANTPEEEDRNARDLAAAKRNLETDKLLKERETASEQRKKEIDRELDLVQREYEKTIEDLRKKRTDEFNELLAQYGTYLQQRKKMDEQYAADLEAVNKRVQSGELDENAAAVLKENLKKGYEESLASLTGNYIKGLVSKAFDPKATRAAMQKAMDVMNELDTDTQPEDSVLAKYGIAPEDWEKVREAVKQTKKELGELIDAKDKQQGKTDIASRLFGSFAEKWSEVKKAFTKDANGQYADAQAGIAGVMEMANMAADSLGKMGEMLGQIGELTGNNNLKEYANGLNGISNVLSGTIQGAQSGGIAGAIVGFAGGMLNTILEDMDNSEAIAREQQAREDASNAIDEFTDSIDSTIDALSSFQDSLTSLDYLNFDRAINSLLSQMSDQLNDSTKRWEGMVAGATDLIMRDNQIGKMVNGPFGLNTIKDWESGQSLIKQTDAAAQLKALGIDLDQLMNVAGGYEATKLIADTINGRMKGMKGELEGLMKELESMRDDPTVSALDLFNKMQEIRKKILELMEYELLVMKAAGKDTTDLENQIRDATLELQKATAEMVGAYAGTDVASVVEDWIKIFDEFGTAGSTAMDKINQSVDKMVANMLKQRIVVKRLEEQINNIWAAADRDNDGNLTDDEMEDAVNGIRNAAQSAKQYYDQLQRALEERGINLDETTGNSFSQAVKGVSEETASIIAGQMNAIRVHQIETQEILRESIARDVETIAHNTQHLVTMDAKMASIDRRLGDLQTTYQTRMS